MRRLLFITAQAGQAAYCIPLWQKWIENQSTNYDFKICAHPHAINVIKKELPSCLPNIVQYLDELTSITPTLQNYQPDIIISSACGRVYEIAASAYARKHGIRHVQFIDSWFNYAQRVLMSNPEGITPDTVCVIDNAAKKEAIEGGIPETFITCTGHPVWERALTSAPNTASRKDIVFAAQPLSEINSMQDLGYTEEDVWKHLIQFKYAFPHLLDNLVYRPHPSQTRKPEKLPSFARFSTPREKIFQTCGTMISMFSAIMVEGYLNGQHVIGLQPGLKKDNICPLYKRGFVTHITNKDLMALRNELENPMENKRNDFSKLLNHSLSRFEDVICRLLV